MLARSGVITDSDQLYCSNGTKFTELNFDATTTTTMATVDTTTESATTTEPVTTTKMVTTVAMTTSATTTTTTTTTTTMATVATTTTTTQMPRQCSAETTILQTGYYEWPLSLAGDNISISCPYGLPGGVALRQCMAEGVWSVADETQCEKASETVQVLAALAEVIY